jgi:hypothetical protein
MLDTTAASSMITAAAPSAAGAVSSRTDAMAINAAIIASVPRSLNRAPIQPAADCIARSMHAPDREKKPRLMIRGSQPGRHFQGNRFAGS